MSPKKSVAWDHFVDKGEFKAECKLCKGIMSYKSGVSNLSKHLQRKHISVNLVRRKQEVKHQLVQAHDRTNIQTTQTVTANIEKTNKIRYDPSTISAFLRRDRHTRKKEIENHLMNLFIYDLQPFSIVEDRGFRELLNFVLPNYVIPSRKYFSNNLLPRLYEEVKINIKSAVNENAKSICLTANTWMSRINKSYLAVTGHYIDQDFILQSVLLECKVLEKKAANHSGLHLAEDLRYLVQEWNIADKVLISVSDNGANIKDAIKSNLEWKHFDCYTHTLNLAVQKVLGNSSIKVILNKVKLIVSHFKRSNLVWSKYQDQANKVVTSWNSTFYMVQRFIELKDEIKRALNNLETSNIINLTTHEWGICESLLLILQPCEQLTREISGQKYISGSSVIPLTYCLISALNEIVSPAYRQENNLQILPEEIEKCRQDLILDIKRRFSNIEQSKTYTVAMFLDPRFKLYYANDNIADNTKKYVIALVTEIIDEDDRNHPSALTSHEVGIQDKRDNSLLWRHYNKAMRNLKQARTAHNRAIIEIQKYLDGTVLTPDMNPLEWWKINAPLYPNLAKLAKLKLNAMASSVSCERLFSVAGNILTDRGLGSRKLEELLFLRQNKK